MNGDTPIAAAESLAANVRLFLLDPTDEQLRKSTHVALLRYESIMLLNQHDPRCEGDCGPCGGVGGVPDTGPNGEMAMTCLTCGGSGKCPGCSESYRQTVEENMRRWASEP
jgi:hypothetical protein